MDLIPDDPTVIQPVFDELKNNFLTHKTKDVSFRKAQMKSLLHGHRQLRAKFDEALQKDLAYTPFMANLLSHVCV
jgi:hypothetical protein